MVALDTIATGVLTAGGAGVFTVAVPAAGDSLAVRAFDTGAEARLEGITLQGAVQGNISAARVRSPRLHDNVQGIRISPGELVSAYSLPAQAGQRLYPSDQLIAEIAQGAAAEFQELVFHLYYSDLGGANGKFATWSDIAGQIIHWKPVQVPMAALVANTWTDTVINVAGGEDLLEADAKYAVCGYSTNAALAAVGVRGQETGNLRACGPGSTSEFPTTEWFIRMSDKHNSPHIPIISANNRGGITASCIARAAVGAGTLVELILAQLAPGA
jgi:hypothetical protein